MRGITGSMCPMGKAASATVASHMVVKDPFTVAPVDPKVPPNMQKDLSAPLINVSTYLVSGAAKAKNIIGCSILHGVSGHETNDSEASEPQIIRAPACVSSHLFHQTRNLSVNLL